MMLKRILSVLGITLLLLVVASQFFTPISPNTKQAAHSPLPNKKLLLQMKEAIKNEKGGPGILMKYLHDLKTLRKDSQPRYKPGYKQVELRKAKKRRRALGLQRASLDWVERGPANVGGRTRSIWVDPEDQTYSTWFVGAVGGGVWKTEDRGQSWRLLTTDIPNLAIGDLKASPANPLILYAGTGEGIRSLPAIDGSGIWKSVDKGESWQALPSTQNDKFGSITRMVVNPEDVDEILVATRAHVVEERDSVNIASYIFHSLDGGQSWVERYTSSNRIEQIIANPQNFKTLFASVNRLGILRSRDGGLSWKMVRDGAPLEYRRMEIAISPTDTNFIYIGAEAPSRNQDNEIIGPTALNRSTDAGDSWEIINPIDQANNFRRIYRSQGWYDNTLAVHPFNPNSVFVGGAGAVIQITTPFDSLQAENVANKATIQPLLDGYREFRTYFPNASSKGVHVDHHYLQFIPIDSASDHFYILNGNDGGIAFSDDSGETFLQTGNGFVDPNSDNYLKGYNTSQFYGLDKMPGQNRYIGGTQDNGSWLSPIDADASSIWDEAPSGDGFEAAWHAEKPGWAIETSQFGSIYRTKDGGKSWEFIAPGERGSFVTQIANTDQEPNFLATTSRVGVVRSPDFGSSWEVVKMPERWRFNGSSTPVSISLADYRVVWSGSSMQGDYRLAVSTDAAKTFTEVNTYEEADLPRVREIITHPFNPRTAYLVFGAADAPKVLRTTDLGQSWEDLSGFEGNLSESNNGFPDVAVHGLVVMPYDTNIIWAGTEIGIVESTNNGQSWHIADNGLPAVSIWEMKIVDQQLIVATHGRGVWTVDIPELANYQPIPAPIRIPELTFEENTGFNGMLHGTYILHSLYDSARLSLRIQQDFETSFFIGPNTQIDTTNFQITATNLPIDTISQAVVSLTAYKNGEVVEAPTFSTLTYQVEENPVRTYSSNFDQAPLDFARFGFNFQQPSDFSRVGLHSRHPYPGWDTALISILRIPIIIEEEDAMFKYNDIALIEPGEEGTTFPSSRFYDFVTVEGTKDKGASWIPMIGYDARNDESWLTAYNNEQAGTETLFRKQEINLLEFFSAGDTVYFRFRLQADPLTEGWGWAIDSIQIQTQAQTVDIPEVELLDFHFSNYPNPFKHTTTMVFTLPQSSYVEINVYNLAGQKVKNILAGFRAAGKHEIIFDGSALKDGVYLSTFTTNDISISRKVFLRK